MALHFDALLVTRLTMLVLFIPAPAGIFFSACGR